ncbi:MAG TPA: hypothetical protein VFB54_17335 [Burkholderiales bacterium]|nr:hypothetical protein [Burkholderiales bacterium]
MLRVVDLARDLDRDRAREFGIYVVSASDWRPAYFVIGCARNDPYFQTRPGCGPGISERLQDEEQTRRKYVQTSLVHRRAQTLLQEELASWMFQGRQLLWHPDPGASPVTDLLAGVQSVQPEYWLGSELGNLRGDLALVGPVICNKPAVTVIVEVESTHRFSHRRLLLGDALGLLVIYVDVSQMPLEALDRAWAQGILEGLGASQRVPGLGVYASKLLRAAHAPIDPVQAHYFDILAGREQLRRLAGRFDLLANRLDVGIESCLLNVPGFPRTPVMEFGRPVTPDWLSLRIWPASDPGKWAQFVSIFARLLAMHADSTVKHGVADGDPQRICYGPVGEAKEVATPMRSLLSRWRG